MGNQSEVYKVILKKIEFLQMTDSSVKDLFVSFRDSVRFLNKSNIHSAYFLQILLLINFSLALCKESPESLRSL